jgi:glycosyltransferase involved in cell wall biosynthesis
MENRIRVLFVVSEFYQAGTERFTFELDRALDKSQFKVDILSLLPLEASPRFSDYYYEKHLELKSDIYFIKDVDVIRHPTRKERLARITVGEALPNVHQPLIDFLDDYTSISVMGEYNYLAITRWMPLEIKKRCLVHIQNSKHQKPDIYANFPKNEQIHFVSGFDEKSIKWELSEFPNYKHTYFGLNLKIENQFLKTTYRNREAPRIGIFTRLTSHKPLDPFLYAFQLVLDKFPKAELHIFGSGDPEQEGLNRYINQLNISNHIHFRGHQTNIAEAAVAEDLDIVWLHGYHGVPGGWAGFDICTALVPQVFWNFGGTKETEYNSSFPMSNRLSEFVNYTLHYLTNPILAKQLALEQRSFVDEHHNIERFIQVMQNLYKRMVLEQYGV